VCSVSLQIAHHVHFFGYISVAMVLGYDEEKNAQLFKCDPAGHFFGHKVYGYFATFLLNEYC
jgi:20S proteasome alpha/beta subunit